MILELSRLDYPAEIVHYADAEGIVTSHGRHLRVCCHGEVGTFDLPLSVEKRLVSGFRLARRLLRLDKAVFLPAGRQTLWDVLVGVYQGKFYRLDRRSGDITMSGKLVQSRGPLHMGICRTDSGNLFLGEYGRNPGRLTVPIYRSTDEGRSWDRVFEFKAGKTKHVHGCFWDPFEKRVWVCTGDLEGENYILVADEDFRDVQWLGDGKQAWRTCHLMFHEDCVIWGMDSPLETSYICRLDRRTRNMERMQPLAGPVWYSKQLSDGWMLVACSVEPGPGVEDCYARVLASQDGDHWQEVCRARKDLWLMPFFKFGVIGFAGGAQTSDEFYLFGEALQGLDGRAFRARLPRMT